MNIQNYGNDLSFCGEKTKILSNMKGMYKRHMALSAEEHMLERQRGIFAGMDAKNQGADVCKEIIIRETLAGHFDYLKGFLETIGKDMSKKAYSTIGK